MSELPKGFRVIEKYPEYMINHQACVRHIATGKYCMLLRVTPDDKVLIHIFSGGKKQTVDVKELRDKAFPKVEEASFLEEAEESDTLSGRKIWEVQLLEGISKTSVGFYWSLEQAVEAKDTYEEEYPFSTFQVTNHWINKEQNDER